MKAKLKRFFFSNSNRNPLKLLTIAVSGKLYCPITVPVPKAPEAEGPISICIKTSRNISKFRILFISHVLSSDESARNSPLAIISRTISLFDGCSDVNLSAFKFYISFTKGAIPPSLLRSRRLIPAWPFLKVDIVHKE